MTSSPRPAVSLSIAAQPHHGTKGKRALFFGHNATHNIVVEVTGP